ncbi:MAG: PCRF domain-containing protein, partial [Desulfobacula sp.]|uniref:PCRF domain-containing protein n=1 Tax=Desulfobacula sp. TaxID=2593537 RepID=UPI0025BA84F3
MPKPTDSRSIFDLPVKQNRLRELEIIISKENFWNDSDKATGLLKERTYLSNLLETWENIYKDIEDADILLELALEESDKDSEKEVAVLLSVLEKKIKKFSVQITLDDEDDARDALVSINAGAGGTDSQDWAEMLLRMYTRWIDKKGYKFQIIDY